MSAAKDLLLDADYDLAIENGDFAVGYSDEQHQALLLLTNQGEWRESPLTGIGLQRYQSGPMGPNEQAMLSREIRIQLERDGYQVATIAVNSDAALTLDAFRP